MISKRLIDQGVKIRTEFLDINKKLDSILKDLQNVAMQLQKHTEELENINKNLDEYGDVESAKLVILNKLTDVEIQGNRLANIYKPVNDQLEDLKKQEESLYRIIKETYPKLSDDEIVSEFEPHIKKII